MRVFALFWIVLLFFFGTSSCNGGHGKDGNEVVKIDSTAKGEPFIIEVVGEKIDTALLLDVCEENGLERPQIYRWKDHYVVYGASSDLGDLSGEIRSAFPGGVIKTYKDPFYVFNRERCKDKSTAKEWDHVILTANLVEDTVLQNEYMTYHATQFQEWPEVSNGFCNADFQQLLLFRNGRQLMLVISIPEGKSLDELNPKTTENNPRVDEWNARMKKYQEGIEGTNEGEVWVFLNNLNLDLGRF
jgi:hypothetical protein